MSPGQGTKREILRAKKHDLRALSDLDVARMGHADFEALAKQVTDMALEDRMENQLLYYQPVGDPNLPAVERRSSEVHLCNTKYLGVGGGNGSSKTETCLVDVIIRATGIIPESMRSWYPRDKMRGPINVRIVVESLTTTLHPIILPKLQWHNWTGYDAPGGERGHYGWIPRTSLVGSSWDKSWSEKLRTLKVIYRNPDDWSRIEGTSQLQFMSYDQDWSDFASGDFHIVMHDEMPSAGIWVENEARTMRVGGQMMLAMTWKEDPTIPVDWLFDKMVSPAERGDEDVTWINLYTIDNPHIDQESIAKQMKHWSKTQVAVRIYGQPIRFSNRIHPLYTDVTRDWCTACKDMVVTSEGLCQECGSDAIVRYCHFEDRDAHSAWPVVCLLDPHPRKPHMVLWVCIDPTDDWIVLRELEVEADAEDTVEAIRQVERDHGYQVALRLMDPNMGRTPGMKRDHTWQDEFDAAGMTFDLANDSEVGRKRINTMLALDEHTERPRITVSTCCPQANYQMLRYVWDEHKFASERDIKQKPRAKHDDYPTLLKYLANYEPSFDALRLGGHRISWAPATRQPRGHHGHHHRH